MKASKQIESSDATPEQLLRLLESQRAGARAPRGRGGRNRAIILVVGMLFIVAAAGAALFVLDHVLSEMRPGAAAAASETASRGNF